MKTRLAAALAALLVVGCATTDTQARRHWLIGTWLMLSDDVEYPLACASGLPIQYRTSGDYHLFEEEGRWQLDGNRLTEIATRITEAGDPDSNEIGRLHRSHIRQSGPDLFRKTFADGNVATFRRCPE